MNVRFKTLRSESKASRIKLILTSNLLLQHIDLGLQAPDLHLPVGAERALACLVLQGLHRLRGLCRVVHKPW